MSVYEAKVRYTNANGFESCAYLDEYDNQFFYGEDKYTGKPVSLRVDETGGWVEV